jgi:hypothetical protein
MVTEQSGGPSVAIEPSGVQVSCPSCGKTNELGRGTSIAFPRVDAFPSQCLVLEALECAHCGCVAFFNPAVTKRSSKQRALPVEVGNPPKN